MSKLFSAVNSQYSMDGPKCDEQATDWAMDFDKSVSASSSSDTEHENNKRHPFPFLFIDTYFSHLVKRALLSPYYGSLHCILLSLTYLTTLYHLFHCLVVPGLLPAFNLPVWWGRRPQTHDEVLTPWYRSSTAIKEKTFLGMKPRVVKNKTKCEYHLIMCYLPLLQQTVSWRHLLVHLGHCGDPLNLNELH